MIGLQNLDYLGLIQNNNLKQSHYKVANQTKRRLDQTTTKILVMYILYLWSPSNPN